MRRYVHPLVQDANYVDLPSIGDAVEQEMRFDGQLPIARPDVVNGTALPAAFGQCRARIADAENVAVGAVLTLIAGAVVPDVPKVGLRGW